jgi:hypothetical protein
MRQIEGGDMCTPSFEIDRRPAHPGEVRIVRSRVAPTKISYFYLVCSVHPGPAHPTQPQYSKCGLRDDNEARLNWFRTSLAGLEQYLCEEPPVTSLYRFTDEIGLPWELAEQVLIEWTRRSDRRINLFPRS